MNKAVTDHIHRLPDQEPVKFLDLDNGQCRYSVEPLNTVGSAVMLCCGAPVVDRFNPYGLAKSFCEFHLKICMAASREKLHGED